LEEYGAWSEGSCLWYNLEEQDTTGEWDEVDSCGGFIVVDGDATHILNEVLSGLTVTPEIREGVKGALECYWDSPKFLFTAQRRVKVGEQFGLEVDNASA